MKKQASCIKISLSLIAFYFSGALSAVLSNVLFHFEAEGYHHIYKDFRKPWIQVWGTFLAMIFLIFGTPIFNKCRCKNKIPRKSIDGWIIFRKVSIPTIFALISTILSSIAYLYLAPSIWQMFRGSTLIFTGFTNRIFHHKPFDIPDVFGIFLTFIGLIFVGASSVITGTFGQTLNYGSSITRELISFVLVFISQAFHSIQSIIEEKIFRDTDAIEYEVASYEGIWGLFFCTFIMMPIANIIPESSGEGFFEQSIESIYMLFHTWKLLVIFILYIILIAVFNITFIVVTTFSTPKERNICDALRPIAVWVFSIMINYFFPIYRAGEPASLFSLIEIVGFILMFLGSCMYNRLFKFTCCHKTKISTIQSIDIPLIDSYGM